MSRRNSHTSGDGVPSTRFGERTPLRSVQNEMVYHSTPVSRLKSTSMSNMNLLKTPKSEAAFCYPDPLKKLTKTTDKAPTIEDPVIDTAIDAASGVGDITFKSFICAGGEVEVTDPSRVSSEEAVLFLYPPLPGYDNDSTFNDSTFNDSMVLTQSSDDHMDHPYCDVGGGDVASAKVDLTSFKETLDCGIGSSAPKTNDIANTTEESTGVENAPNRQEDVTFKSFICTGGEVELSEATRLSEDYSILLLKDQSVMYHLPYDESMNPSISIDDLGPQSTVEHAYHPYFHNECSMASTSADFPSSKEPSVSGLHRSALSSSALKTSVVVCTSEESAGVQNTSSRQGDVTLKSFICTGGEVEVSDATRATEKTVLLPRDQSTTSLPYNDISVNPNIMDDQSSLDHAEHPYCHVEGDGAAATFETEPPATSEPSMGNTSLNAGFDDVTCQLFPECPKQGPSDHTEDVAAPSVLQETDSSRCDEFGASARSSTLADEDEPTMGSHSRSGTQESSGARDSALGSSGHAPPLPANSAEEAGSERHSDPLTNLSDFSSVAKWCGDTLQYELFSPVLSATPASRSRLINQNHALAQMEDSALEPEKDSVLNSAEGSNPNGSLWPAFFKSPMPQPQFNSTALATRSIRKPLSTTAGETEKTEVHAPGVEHPSQGEKEEDGLFAETGERVVEEAPQVKPLPELMSLLDVPLVPEGPLKQQLIQMAQLLILASGKMGATAEPPPSMISMGVGTSMVECHSACVGTSPVRMTDCSANTSGLFERKREFSVSDACTTTDSLLWNLAPGSLDSVPRQELEQRLTSSLIMVEALVQQLSSARGLTHHPRGPGPSELRDKLVQTDHTEFNQITIYKDLYETALERICELEVDQNSLQDLLQSIQLTRTTMTALGGDTEAALTRMKQIGDVVREDHRSLVTQYGQMKVLYDKCKESQARMVQKVRSSLQERETMRQQMEGSMAARDAAFSVTEQLRAHCALRISELEENVGSHQELMAALTKTYPKQVALNKAYVETLDSASELLKATKGDQDSLNEELRRSRRLIQGTTLVLLKLKQKAAAAIAERNQHLSERDQALDEREQIQEELDQATTRLQDDEQQIGDLNLQMTIMSSEMGVLRQKLSEGEEERAQLERKVTELSATVSSSLASYAFLEQALASESSKSQQSWQEVQQAINRASELEAALGQSEQRVCELSQALGHSEEQLIQLQAHCHTQSLHLHSLQEASSQLCTMREMNEFLQMENDLAREQVAESEGTLRVNLHSLRQRNIECEDLKAAVHRLLCEREESQAELEATRAGARSTQLDLGEQLDQAVTNVTLLHHTLRGLTNDLHSELSGESPETSNEKASQLPVQFERHPSSFVDSIMVALTSEKEGDDHTEPPADHGMTEAQSESLGSGTSAFTRVTASVTPQRSGRAPEVCPEERQSSVVVLLADLAHTVTELLSTAAQLRQHRDAQQGALHNTICGLQGEQHAQARSHSAEVSELTQRLNCLQTQLDRGAAALQNKAQDEKTLKGLLSEVNEARELLHKHKTDNIELRREGAELRRSLHQSQVESQALREELGRASSQSANAMRSMDEKIGLLKEVEKLKRSLQEVQDGRSKLLERAKRHQIVHETNQRKQESELRVLDDMIETVRKTLSSVPEVVKNCKALQTLVEFIG